MQMNKKHVKLKMIVLLLLVVSACTASNKESVYHAYLSEDRNKSVDIYLDDKNGDEVSKLVISYSVGIADIQERDGVSHEEAYLSILDIYNEYKQLKNLSGVLYIQERNAYCSFPKEQRENNPIKVTVVSDFIEKEYDEQTYYVVNVTIVIDYSKDNNKESLSIIYDKLGLSESDFDENGVLLHSKLKEDKQFILHDAFLGETHEFSWPKENEDPCQL